MKVVQDNYIDNIHMTTYIDEYTFINSLNTKDEILIAIDPSKSNTSMIVSNLAGDILEILQLIGKDITVDDYCKRVIYFISTHFYNCNIVSIYEEEMILKEGNKYYYSNRVLHDVRHALDTAFKKELGLNCLKFINNWYYKSKVLPAEYRKRSHKKGSQDFLDPSHKWNDNVTDALCIHLVQQSEYKSSHKVFCTRSENYNGEAIIKLVDVDNVNTNTLEEFIYNENYNILQNANYYLNRRYNFGFTYVAFSQLKLQDLYKYAYGLSLDSNMILLVGRYKEDSKN